MLILFLSIISFVNAAFFESYQDQYCTIPISKTLVFNDVCTWTSNEYTGSWSIYSDNCSNDKLNVLFFNQDYSPTCQGTPNFTISINNNCTKFDNFYLKAIDFTCNSQNKSYNILSHFQSDCKDGGISFSIQLGEETCQSQSFAPTFFNWDTTGSFTNPYYQLNVFNSTNDSCIDQIALYQTESFPIQCLSAVKPFNNIYLDIYNSFNIY